MEQYKEGCRFASIWSGRDSAIQRGHCKMLALPAGLLVSQIKVSIVYPELSNKGQNYRLLHFIVGASNFQRPQSFMGSSHGVNCTGSEQSIAECTKNGSCRWVLWWFCQLCALPQCFILSRHRGRIYHYYTVNSIRWNQCREDNHK